jgi:hypothetical protein
VQAAAALTGHDVADVARAWAPDTAVIEPNADVDAASVRGVYAERRLQIHPERGDRP